LEHIRAEISNRLLVSEETIVGQINPDGALQVAHKATIRGLRISDGKLVELSLVSVVNTTAAETGGKKKVGKNCSGTAKVQMESFVFVVNEVEN